MKRTINTSLICHARDTQRLNNIKSDLSSTGFGVKGGLTEMAKTNFGLLGESAERVIIASNSLRSLTEETFVFGGWCVMRTKDTELLKVGLIPDPLTGETRIITSVADFCEWLENVISIDQITEPITPTTGKNYVGISEVFLWHQKISWLLERHFGRILSNYEMKVLLHSIRKVERRKAEITKRYIELATRAKDINLVRIVDEDIYDALTSSWKHLMKQANISVDKLCAPVIKRRTQRQKTVSIDDLTAIYRHVHDYSLSWFYFTPDYFYLLKKLGFVKSENGLIISARSAIHKTEIESKDVFFTAVENYYDKLGKKAKRPFSYVVYDEPASFNFKIYKISKDISEIPNNLNYKEYVKSVKEDPLSMSLILPENPIYMLAYNYFPYGEVLVILHKMQRLSEDYKEFKKSIGKKQTGRREIIEEYRMSCEEKMRPLVKSLCKEMIGTFDKLFK